MTDTEAAAYASVCRTATLSASGTVKGYTITPSPAAKVLSANVETALYYDTYDFIDNLSIGSSYKFKNPFTALGLSSRVSAGQRGKPLSGGSKGKLTGLYTGAGWESYHYNPWGQEVQRYATGYNRGRRTTFYNHDGSVASVHCQYLEGSLAQTSFSSLRDRDTYFTYDKAGRLTKTRVLERYIPPHTSSEKVDSAITVITYDRLGRLSSEKRGTVTRTTAYDVHGWLRSQTTQLSGNTLTETLTYAGGTAPRYNGFISGRSWDGNTYAYTYDGRGFLSEAKYTSSVPLADYSETMTYDERGAVITLKRKGVTDLSPSGTKSYGLLDDIHASYSGNRPTTLTVESAAEVFDRRTGIRGSGTFSMTYDDAGRLVSDASRGITSVEYDNNGLQTSVTIGSGDTRTEVIHSRDGLGNHLSTDIVRFYPNGSPPWHIEQSSYTGDGHIIRDGKLVMSRFPGGYFDYSGNPHYYLTDWQGNNIGVYDRNGVLEQRTDYYPSGEPWLEPEYAKTGNENRHLFGDKERQPAQGLNEYDFTARPYVASFPRFTTVDPLAEKYPHLSPYLYCVSNPINFIDPDGLDIRFIGSNSATITIKTNLLDYEADISSLGLEWEGDLVFEGDNILSAALDIVGIFDPSGVADVTNAGIYFRNGNWIDGSISLAGTIPFIGDIAKVKRAPEIIKTFDKATSGVTRNREIGKIAEREVANDLKKEFPNAEIGEQISVRFNDGSRTVLDHVVKVDDQIILLNETKSGKSRLSTNQKRFYVSGEPGVFTGQNAERFGVHGQRIQATKTNCRLTRVKFK